MKIKKILLLATMALSAIAFTAPAAAQAQMSWSEAGEISGSGSLAWTDPSGLQALFFVSSFSGEVEGTEGSITNFTIHNPVSTNMDRCAATASVGGLPWAANLAEPDKLTVADMNIYLSFKDAPPWSCPWNGSTLPIAGDMILKALAEGGTEEGHCASANPYLDDLFIQQGWRVNLTGTLCWKGPNITGIES